MKPSKLCLAIVVMLALALALTGCAAGEKDQDQQTEETGAVSASEPQDPALALAPLLVLAIFVERVLEVMWDNYESGNKVLMVVLGTKWIAEDKHLAGDHIQKIKKITANKETDDYKFYEKGKRLRSHWAGTIIAIGLCFLTGYALFSSLDMKVPNGPIADVLLTSLMLGWGGTEFTHSVVDALVKRRNLWQQEKETSKQIAEDKKVSQSDELLKLAERAQQSKIGTPETRKRVADKLLGRIEKLNS
ncbi:MAG: hypothetical protein SXV54_09665 [Chloroflexota bacterium]|nr:hypothetical protein [Chloroflexota bacterium]